MLTSVRSLMAATILATSAVVAAPAAAQDIEFSGSATIASEYRFRGVDLSGGDIAVQGSVDAALGGFYVGAWGSSIDEDTVGVGHTELDLYGGYGGSIGAFTYDVGVIGYLFPNAGPGDADYIEFYGSLGAAVGPAEVTFGVAYAPEQDSLDFDPDSTVDDDDNLYLYGDLSIGIPNSPVTLTGHLGYTDGALVFNADQADTTAWDWSVGGEVALGEVVSIGVAYVGVEGDPTTDDAGAVIFDMTDDAVVVTLNASI